MSKIVVLFHSGYGHTAKVAEAVAAAAGAQLMPISAEGLISDADWATLAAADAIVFGTPTLHGRPELAVQALCRCLSKPWYAQAWKDKIAAGFTNSATLNGDKQGTMQYLHT